MDTEKGPRKLSVGKTHGFPIHHNAMRHVNITITSGKKKNRYQTIWISNLDDLWKRYPLSINGSYILIG